MPTNTEYFEAIGRAGLTVADQALVLVDAEKSGCAGDWSKVFCGVKAVRIGQYFFDSGDYTSSGSVNAYNCLLKIAGTNYSSATLDPNAQIPNITVDITTIGASVNSAIYSFANETTVTLDSYQSVQYPLFGNMPEVSIWIDNGDGSYNEDTANVPSIVRSGGPMGSIQSITWTYPVPTAGYIQILGIQPTI